MDFRDAQVGVAAGDRVSTTDGGPGIFKTTDAGGTWVRKSSESSSDVLWLNSTTAIASVLGPIFRSTDTGETWSQISSQLPTGLDKMALLPNGTIVGVSGLGDAWRSADGGLTWTQTLVGLGALPAVWSVSFSDNQIGAIVGQSGFIFKTTDGGLTWAMLNNGIGGVSFYDLEMFDDNAGLAVGDNGYFLRTANGGNRWETGRLIVTGVVAGRNENLQAVDVVDENFAVAAGFEGVVYKTFDRGVTWQSIGYPNLPGDFFISDVKFINRNRGYVTGNNPGSVQNMFLTTDGGATWTPANTNGGHSMDFVDANHGWVVGISGVGSRTTDGGATWQQMLLPSLGFSTLTILKIDFINENEGWAVGWDGYAAHTIDGGHDDEATGGAEVMCLRPLAVPGQLAQTRVGLAFRMAIMVSATARLPWPFPLKRLVWRASERPSSPETISASIRRRRAVARTRWPLQGKPLDSTAVADRSQSAQAPVAIRGSCTMMPVGSRYTL
jgi:photosystem II stability/assembly factor-like uncharacterized protein